MTIAETIKNLRIASGKTQQQVADACGIKQGVYTNWETGRYAPNAENLARLADCFDCTVDYIIGRETEEGSVIISHGIELSNDEQEFLKLYRQLPNTQRFAALVIGKGVGCDDQDQSFGDRLRSIRRSCGLTQTELAERTGLSQSNINTWERNRSLPLPHGLIKLADCFGCSVDYLLGREVQEHALEDPFIAKYKKLTQEKKNLLKGYLDRLSEENETKD